MARTAHEQPARPLLSSSPTNTSAVTTEQNQQPPHLTGVGLITQRHSFFAPEDHNAYYNTAAPATPSVNWNMGLKTRYPAVLFHHACWKLWRDQLRLLSGQSNKTKSLITHFYNVARCFPRDRLGQVCRADGYGGAMSAWALPQNPIESWEFLKADPHVVTLSSVQPGDLPFQEDASPDVGVLHASGTSVDILAKLPYDVALALISILPTSDVCSLRQASRTIAWLIYPPDLPRSFWRSRFFMDEETEMLCDKKELTTLGPGHDWRGLYFGVKHALRDTTRHGHVRNRRRVWRCLRSMTECVISLVEQTGASGTSSSAMQRPEDCRNGQEAHGCVNTTETKRHPAVDLLSTKYIPLDIPAASLAFCVSTIEFDGATFISGFRVPGRDEDKEVCRVGLVFPASEVRLDVPAQPEWIRVATATNGVVGLGFSSENGAKCVTAGLIDDLPAGAGVTTLRPEPGYHVAGLSVGLDVSLVAHNSAHMLTFTGCQNCFSQTDRTAKRSSK